MEVFGNKTELFSDEQNNLQGRQKHLMYAIHSTQNLAKQLSYQFISIFASLLGASGTQIGFLTAGQNITQTAAQGYFGRLSDKHGRKKFLVIGFFLAGVTFILAAFSQTPLQLIFGVFLNGLALSILAPAWEGAISDKTNFSTRGGFIGKINSVATYYATVVIFLFGLSTYSLSENEQIFGYRMITLFSGVNFLVGAILSYAITEERFKEKIVEKTHDFFLPLRDPVFRRFALVVISWWLSMSVAWSYFPIYFAKVLKLTIFQVAIINSVFSLTMAVVSYYFGKVLDKKGPKIGLVIGLGTFWLFPFTLAFANTFLLVVLTNVFAGFSLGIGLPSIQMYVMEMAGPEKAGQYSGTYFMLWGVFTFIGSLTGGIILDFFEPIYGLPMTMFYLLIGVAAFRFLTGMMMTFVHNTRV